MFLEQFGIATCVLNSELPAVSRCRAVTQFNSGTYDIIIASDEKSLEEVNILYLYINIYLYIIDLVLNSQLLFFTATYSKS